MGCCGGNGGRHKQSFKIVSMNNSEPTMIEYFQSLGWGYIGNCGCRENYKVYANSEYPTWQIWIHAMGNSMQMRYVYSAADIQNKFQGGLLGFKECYHHAINSEKQIK